MPRSNYVSLSLKFVFVGVFCVCVSIMHSAAIDNVNGFILRGWPFNLRSVFETLPSLKSLLWEDMEPGLTAGL